MNKNNKEFEAIWRMLINTILKWKYLKIIKNKIAKTVCVVKAIRNSAFVCRLNSCYKHAQGNWQQRHPCLLVDMRYKQE